MTRPHRNAVGDWVRAGLITPKQGDDILRHMQVAPPPSTWMDAAVSFGVLCGTLLFAAAAVMPLATGREMPAHVLWGVFAAGAFSTVLAVLLRSWDERASEYGFVAAMGIWGFLAFVDAHHSPWTAAPVFAFIWVLPFLSLRPETRLVGAAVQWPAAVLFLQTLGLPTEYRGTEVQMALSAVYLLLLALALPRHGPWRHVPRAALVVVGLAVTAASLYGWTTGPSLRLAAGALAGIGFAVAVFWLLRPDRALFHDRFPQFDLDRIAPT